MAMPSRRRHRRGDWLLQLPKAVFLRLYGLLIRVRVSGRNRLPRQKDVIIAVNHKAGIDPIAVQIGLRERIFFATDGRWFSSRLGRFFFSKLCDGFPVYSGKVAENVAGVRQCFDFLRRGYTVGIFPEGGLVRNRPVGEIEDGAAFLSLKSGKPIVPVYIHYPVLGPDPGGFVSLPLVWEGIVSVFGNIFRRIKIVVGDPIWPGPILASGKDPEAALKEINRNIFDRFTSLAESVRKKS